MFLVISEEDSTIFPNDVIKELRPINGFIGFPIHSYLEVTLQSMNTKGLILQE